MTTGATPLSPALARAAAPAPGTITVPGNALLVQPGQALAARVLAIAGGQVELALAGGRVSAQTNLPLVPGQTVELVVREAEAERVTLRLATPPAASTVTPAATRQTPQAIMEEAGLPAATARAVLAAVAQTGATPGTPADLTRLAARALESGVKAPADAAAFARLEAQGLPTTPAAVRGLATLLEGSPIGRALTGVLSDAGAAARATPGPPVPVGTPAAVPAPQGSAEPEANATPGSAAMVPRPPQGTPSPPALGVLPARPDQPAGGAAGTSPPLGAPPGGQGAALGELVARLTRLADAIADGAASGDPESFRAALRRLGHGLEAELARGQVPDEDTLRTRLHELASRPGPEAVLARAAERLSDSIAAQAFAGPTLPGSEQAQQGTSSQGVYLQVPLPGGQSAEVRINPDAHGEGPDGEDRPRRIAFLLHLSALGPVLIEATHGPTGTEAIVRLASADARAYVAQRARELAESLRRASESAGGVRVTVERFSGPPPTRLLPPPPATGLDFQA